MPSSSVGLGEGLRLRVLGGGETDAMVTMCMVVVLHEHPSLDCFKLWTHFSRFSRRPLKDLEKDSPPSNEIDGCQRWYC
jgi:hypothetical protein